MAPHSQLHVRKALLTTDADKVNVTNVVKVITVRKIRQHASMNVRLVITVQKVPQNHLPTLVLLGHTLIKRDERKLKIVRLVIQGSIAHLKEVANHMMIVKLDGIAEGVLGPKHPLTWEIAPTHVIVLMFPLVDNVNPDNFVRKDLTNRSFVHPDSIA